jgi:hypothetical protein
MTLNRELIEHRLTEWRNVAVNLPRFVWQKSSTFVMLLFLQTRMRYWIRFAKMRRWYWGHKKNIQLRLAGYKFITSEQFISEFPPNKKHGPCHGKGWHAVQLPDKRKIIRFCTCVTEPYKASKKKYIVKQPI